MPVDVRDYRELYRKTRLVEPEIRKDLRKRLRTCGKIGGDAARRKIMEWPVHGGISGKVIRRNRRIVHRPLRATLASQIRVSATGDDVLIRQGRKGLTGNSAADLPRNIDRGGWKHPVYGHRPEVFQTGFPYFKKEIESKRPEMVDEASKVLDTIARLLT